MAVRFKFEGTDFDGDELAYEINWGDGVVENSPEYLPMGESYKHSHQYANIGRFDITYRTYQNLSGQITYSTPSPLYTIIIIPVVKAEWGQPQQLCGYSANYYKGTSTNVASVIGEPAVGKMSSGTRTLTLGYQGEICEQSLFWRIVTGAEGEGGLESNPPAAQPGYQNKTSAQLYALNTSSAIAEILEHQGNQTIKDDNGNTWLNNGRRIFYDGENRPNRIIMADGSEELYTYDYAGQRVSKVVIPDPIGNPAVNTKTVYIGTVYDETYEGLSLIETNKYVYAGTQRVATISSTQGTLYFHSDHLGSTSLMTDSSGSVARTTQYNPYGNTFSDVILSGSEGSAGYRHMFTGHISDSNTGLMYYGARYYDPALGTFLTPDTVVQDLYDPQTLNRYAYCRNNPIIYTDPTGYDFWRDMRNIGYNIVGITTFVLTGGNFGFVYNETDKGGNFYIMGWSGGLSSLAHNTGYGGMGIITANPDGSISAYGQTTGIKFGGGGNNNNSGSGGSLPPSLDPSYQEPSQPSSTPMCYRQPDTYYSGLNGNYGEIFEGGNNYPISSYYQLARQHPTLGITRPHNGIDIACPTGTRILSPINGKVNYAGLRGGYGNQISIEGIGRYAGYSASFSHLSAIKVTLDLTVSVGQFIGLSGNTGTSSGSHLHYEVSENGKTVNPLDYYRKPTN